MRYGHKEFEYAEPIANGLVDSWQFRHWLISRTPFAEYAATSMLLYEQQKTTRTRGAENWWRSYWVTKSYAHFDECGERETDLLAVFEGEAQFRFALHIEIKAPGDRFGADQAKDYRRRATCWAGRDRAPRTVVPHDSAATMLCCEKSFHDRELAAAGLFDCVVTFEEISSFLTIPSSGSIRF